jgi:hypothetical protein
MSCRPSPGFAAAAHGPATPVSPWWTKSIVRSLFCSSQSWTVYVPGARPLLPRQARLDVLGIERRGVGRAGRWDLELHVVVGEGARGEPLEVLAADDHADQVRREVAHVMDRRLEHAPRRALGTGLGHRTYECIRMP